VVLGLAVLGLAAVIFHKGWYEGFPQRLVRLERDLVSLVHREWRALRPDAAAVSPQSTPGPIADRRPSINP
jgi:hypothetical protein